MDTLARSARATLPRLALALLLAAPPSALRAQDSVFIPQPVPVSIVPDLRGLTVEDARARLSGEKLEVGALDEVVASGVPGTVARQQPAAGARVAPGSAVPLWLVAAEVAVMPAVMGLPPERALRMIRAAGLRQGEVTGWQTRGPIRVIGHTFRAGERVPAGAVVNVSLGIPPAPARVARADTPRAVVKVDSGAVPDVRTLGLAAARARLDSAGLAATFDSAFADSAGWTVATQAPDAGARVPTGSPVQLAFAPPPAPPPVAVVVPPPVSSALQPSPVAAPAPPPAEPSRVKLLVAAAVLLIIAAGAGARRMRARRAAPPVTGVRVALRTDAQPRSSVQGPPIGLPRLRLRLRPGLGEARIAAGNPLFRAKGGAG